MIYEIAEIEIAAGREDAFVAAVGEAAPLFRAAQGCRSMALQRSHEHPGRFRLFVGWDTVDDHMVGFRESAAFGQWRALVGPHFAAPPKVEHSAVVLDLF